MNGSSATKEEKMEWEDAVTKSGNGVAYRTSTTIHHELKYCINKFGQGWLYRDGMCIGDVSLNEVIGFDDWKPEEPPSTMPQDEHLEGEEGNTIKED